MLTYKYYPIKESPEGKNKITAGLEKKISEEWLH